MANGKLEFATSGLYALTLDGTAYPYLPDDDTLDVGTADFAVDWYGVVSDAYGGVWAKLAGKYDGASYKGWELWAHDTNLAILFEIDDGSGTKAQVQTDNGVITLGTPFWVRVEADRDGLASIYINGNLAASGSISGKAGSLDNTAELKIGQYVVGSVGLVRIDKGRLLGASWVSREWDRIRYGWPREQAFDFTETWNFAQTLTGLSASARTLTMSAGSAVYEAGYPSSVSETFAVNYSFGFDNGFSDTLQTSRAESGALRGYAMAPRKQRYTLPFQAIDDSQAVMLQAAYLSGNPVRFWPESSAPRYVDGYIVTVPTFTSRAPNSATAGILWDAELEIEEI